MLIEWPGDHAFKEDARSTAKLASGSPVWGQKLDEMASPDGRSSNRRFSRVILVGLPSKRALCRFRQSSIDLRPACIMLCAARHLLNRHCRATCHPTETDLLIIARIATQPRSICIEQMVFELLALKRETRLCAIGFPANSNCVRRSFPTLLESYPTVDSPLFPCQ